MEKKKLLTSHPMRRRLTMYRKPVNR